MDLGDIWQAHKRFILGVGAGLLVFLIARSLIGSTWNVLQVSRQASGTLNNIRRLEVPRSEELSRVESEAAEYRESLERLCAAMHYTTPAEYVLPRTGSPDLLFNEIRERATEQLVNVARRRNIDVDPTLGLPPLTPSGREAIQRTLRGLAVVEHVVTAAIVAGVSSVDKIQTAKPRARRATEGAFVDELEVSFEIRGRTPAIAALVERLARAEDGYVAVRDHELRLDEKDVFGRMRLKLTVAALEVDAEARLPGGRR